MIKVQSPNWRKIVRRLKTITTDLRSNTHGCELMICYDLLLHLTETDLCKYADDTTIYACDSNLKKRLKKNAVWFENNYLKGSNFRELAKFHQFLGQFAKISSREMSQGQSLAKINSRE